MIFIEHIAYFSALRLQSLKLNGPFPTARRTQAIFFNLGFSSIAFFQIAPIGPHNRVSWQILVYQR
jgi:hypothetical protein